MPRKKIKSLKEENKAAQEIAPILSKGDLQRSLAKLLPRAVLSLERVFSDEFAKPSDRIAAVKVILDNLGDFDLAQNIGNQEFTFDLTEKVIENEGTTNGKD